MELGPLRALTRELTQAAFGVAATVSVILVGSPDVDPPIAQVVETTGVWMTLSPEPQPFGVDLGRREPRRVLAIPISSTLTTVPRGTLIEAADEPGGTVRTWRVDGLERSDPGLMRVLVVPA
jgi:hypothetical protein